MAAPWPKRPPKPFILQLSVWSIAIPVQHTLVIQQARRATTALNSLLWSKHISVNTKKRTFYSDRKHFKLRLGIMDTALQVKEKQLSTEIEFWKWTARISRLLKEMRSSEKKCGKQPKWMTWPPGGRWRRFAVGKGSWQGYEAEEFNIWRRSKLATIATDNQ
jgi:hypothetical protein